MRLGSVWRAFGDPAFRRDLLWRRLSRPPGVFQISGDTGEDRYPEIFRFVRDTVGGGPGVSLLSFGCSTGEEVFTLRRYFPRAAIDGVDINPYRIGASRARWRREGRDPRLRFIVAGSAIAIPPVRYDAIFCLAVLRHGGLRQGGEAAPRCDDLIRFEDAARLVGELARRLKPGGLLAIAHSNFRFTDMPVSNEFAVALTCDPDTLGPPLYGPDNRLLPGVVYHDLVFRKRAAASEGTTAETRPHDSR